MHKEYLEQALIKMQEDLFFVIKNKRSCYPTKKYPDGKKFENGLKAKESFIRSSKFIDQIHQAVKKSFNEINKNLNFKPKINNTKPEEKIKGLIKFKKQDVTIRFKEFSDSLPLLVNIRSQMSSIEKNFDTILERAFAEVVNMRLENNNYIMGEVFLIPFYELNQEACEKNEIKFDDKPLNFEKFFSSYNLINNREKLIDEKNNFYKCDKICLLVVDFRLTPPKIISDFGNDKLNTGYKNLHYENFSNFLLEKYKQSINAD